MIFMFFLDDFFTTTSTTRHASNNVYFVEIRFEGNKEYRCSRSDVSELSFVLVYVYFDIRMSISYLLCIYYYIVLVVKNLTYNDETVKIIIHFNNPIMKL